MTYFTLKHRTWIVVSGTTETVISEPILTGYFRVAIGDEIRYYKVADLHSLVKGRENLVYLSFLDGSVVETKVSFLDLLYSL